MKLSKLFSITIIALAMTLSIPGFSTDVNPVARPNAPTEGAMPADVQKMVNRLEEIKGMDLKSLPRSERKALKKEVRQIEKKMADVGGGVYISAAALLVIIILLILFL